ncbi:hypothetical protein C2E23DRAFT_299190 [Lenzites betulinus]|nr:hypothetical protein C2E23DRAFT_299190 [Lenzites betulinus]
MRFSSRFGLVCFFALGTFFQYVPFPPFISPLTIPRFASAVPAATGESSTSSAQSSTPTAHTSTSDAQATRTTARNPGAAGADDATQTTFTDRLSSTADSSTTSKHSIIIPPTVHRTHPHSSWSPTPGAPLTRHFPPPNPTSPANAPPVNRPPAPSQSGQPPVAIAFEVLGGVVVLLVLAGLVRCFVVWRRTPPRDRIEALMSRHRLEREMEEMERERMERLNRALEARRWHPPPPPYQPAPEYDAVVQSPPAEEETNHAQAAEHPG